MLSKDIKGITEAYVKMYQTEEVIEVEITEELIDEIVDELVEELVEEGYVEEEAYSLVEEATDTYIDEAKVTFGHDTTARRESGAPVGARRRYGRRKAGEALSGAKNAAKGAYKTAKAKAASAALDVSLAGSMAKKKAGEVKRAAQEAPGKARAAASDAKKKAKGGIKGFIKRQAEKVVSRMSEELESLKASGLFSESEIAAFAKADLNEADSIEKMRERAAKRRQQRYGKSGGGGRDDFRPYTKADYERGEKKED